MDRYVTDIKNGCYQNPVLPMDFSDPDAIRVGEDYYLISSSFTYLPGVPVNLNDRISLSAALVLLASGSAFSARNVSLPAYFTLSKVK